VGGASMVLDTNTPLNEFLNVSLKLDAASASVATPAGVANGGFWAFPSNPKPPTRSRSLRRLLPVSAAR